MGNEFWFLIEDCAGSPRASVWPRAREPQQLKDQIQAALRGEVSPEARPPILLLDPLGAERDYMEVESIREASVCSQLFLDSARQAGDLSAAYPIQLLRSDSGAAFEKPFYLWIPQPIEGAIDWQSSEQFVDRYGRGRLTKIVLDHSGVGRLPSVFRPAGSTHIVANDPVRQSMEQARVRGVAFAPLDSAYVPWEGVKAQVLRRHLLDTPDDADGWCELGRLMVGLHRPGQAIEALDRALTLKPTSSEVFYLRGAALQELGQTVKALDSFKKAVDQGDLQQIPTAYPKLLREMGRYQDALTVAERLVAQYQGSPIGWFELGAAHAGLEHFPMALEALNQAQALGIDPHRDAFHAAKGEVLFRLGQYQEAADTFDEGLRSSGSGIELLRGKAKALRALGRAIEAELVEEHVRKHSTRSRPFESTR